MGDARSTLSEEQLVEWRQHLAEAFPDGLPECFAGALRADNFNASVKIDTGQRGGSCSGLCCWYFFLLPRLVLTPMHETVGRGSVAPRRAFSKSSVAPTPLPQDDDAASTLD